ncbi:MULTISPECIES: hypothetical protein [unclassified Paenibacillus]|uniref:hypothetical protein n=1 Tax=unclassified Paenibacillus TaxID=185978 RepID=UPI00034DFFB2|nr:MULTISPECIES: hypothetical protein [unclassified Paenibacillus]EPD81377.1 hypothetical protein HMPREF1207_05135 [Paenibacillus sp. HGH0039]
MFKKSFLSLLITLSLLFSSLGFSVHAAPQEDATYTEFLTTENKTGVIQDQLIEPQAANFSCNTGGWIVGSSGATQFTSQISLNGTLAWGLQLTPLGADLFGPMTTVWASYGSVEKSGSTRVLFPASIYTPHNLAYPGMYHGSISKYNYVGSSSPGSLEPGDVINLQFNLAGSSGATGIASISCRY